jgi:uncharacterized protein YdeI (YjbR/CyaY-like superfamily)
MIVDPGDYFARGCGRCARFDTPDCATRRWAEGLAALRRLCLGAGLVETAKWGHPCYMHAGRNVAILGAHRDGFRIGFFEPGLLVDAQGVLAPSGPNTRHPDTIRFTANGAVAAMAPAVAELLAQGKAHAEAGRRAPREAGEPEVPDALADALDADPELAEAFARLTPGRRRSYAVALSSAKTQATREARVARFRDRILAGKGATER